jgi:hypothetical protein
MPMSQAQLKTRIDVYSANADEMRAFFIGLLLLCACTLMFEVILTRLLSVVSWYYLAFVSVSMAMFGMTAGALVVQLRPAFFAGDMLPLRLFQAVLAMAATMPLALLILLAIPLGVSRAVQSAVSFLLFSSVVAVPFFFSGVAVCIALTKMPFPRGRVYFVDLAGAGVGCLGAVGLLGIFDAPSAIFAISALLFLSAAAFAVYAQRPRLRTNCQIAAASMLIVACLNASTVYGIQPIWSKGAIDTRSHIFAEVWNSISRVRIYDSGLGEPLFWGPSPHAPALQVDTMNLDIDNDASTQILHFSGDLSTLQFLRFDVTSIGAELRHGGTAAIIGVGGGRDVLNCAANGFTRIVGIEVNSAIVKLTSRQLDSYSGFSKIPDFALYNDEGRNFLARSGERFDVIQASLVDTWAATTAGAMTLSENSLYTVDGWRVFYSHLKPGGVITFSRWYDGPQDNQTYRLFSVAWAMLLSEGVANPSRQLVLIESGGLATLLASNQPFSPGDIDALKRISTEMEFTPLFLPGEPVTVPELRQVSRSRTLSDMARLQEENGADYSPTFDSSPYFFNSVHIRALPKFLAHHGSIANLQADLCLFAFFLSAIVLVIAVVALPACIALRQPNERTPAPKGAIVYFVSIGLGFMCVELGMMQQLSIFLGPPVYSMVVVLAGLILSAGIGSFASDRWPASATWQLRILPAASAALVVLYFALVLPVMHAYTAALLWQRILICLALITPPGFILGFCFPIGMRWMAAIHQEHNLPWMWALNGAASTLGSFVAMLISMETSIGTCVLTAAAFYLLAALVPLPRFRSSQSFGGS